MESIQSLLPSFKPKKLHNLEILGAGVINSLLIEVKPLKDIFNAQKCDVKYLPYLAHANGVDIWNESFTETNKRNLISISRKLHKYKGTLWAMQEILKALDMSSDETPAIIKEGLCIKYDGSHKHDGTYTYGDKSKWRYYTIKLSKAVTIKKGLAAKELLEKYAPKRSILKLITYSKLNAYDGTIKYDGSYTHGTIGVVND